MVFVLHAGQLLAIQNRYIQFHLPGWVRVELPANLCCQCMNGFRVGARSHQLCHSVE